MFMQQPVTTLALPAQVGDARDLMNQKNCHALPLVKVTEGNGIQVQGIVTSDDLMGVYDDTVSVEQVMTQQVLAVDPDTEAKEAACIMLNKKIHHLIVQESGRVIGMISSLDFVRLVAEAETTL